MPSFMCVLFSIIKHSSLPRLPTLAKKEWLQNSSSSLAPCRRYSSIPWAKYVFTVMSASHVNNFVTFYLLRPEAWGTFLSPPSPCSLRLLMMSPTSATWVITYLKTTPVSRTIFLGKVRIIWVSSLFCLHAGSQPGGSLASQSLLLQLSPFS